MQQDIGVLMRTLNFVATRKNVSVLVCALDLGNVQKNVGVLMRALNFDVA
jgi:hypothetical protein